MWGSRAYEPSNLGRQFLEMQFLSSVQASHRALWSASMAPTISCEGQRPSNPEGDV